MCAGGIYRGKSGIISTWRYFTKDTASDNINCTAVCYAWLCNNTGDISGRTDYEYACSSAERAYYSARDDCPFRHQQRALPCAVEEAMEQDQKIYLVTQRNVDSEDPIRKTSIRWVLLLI